MSTPTETASGGGLGKKLLIGGLLASPLVLPLIGVLLFTVVFLGMFGSPPATGAPCEPQCCGLGTPVQQGDNVKTSVAYFTGRGMSKAGAAGLVGNFQMESGPSIDPTATNSIGYKGIAQWDPRHRWPMLVRFAADLSISPVELGTQLRFAAWELGVNTEWAGHASPFASVGAQLRVATDPAQAAKVVFDRYEVPGDDTLPRRQSYAQQIYRSLADSPGSTPSPTLATFDPAATPTGAAGESSSPAGPGQPGAGCATGGGDIAAFQSLVLSYAWAEWAPDGRLQRRDGYATAVEAAKKSGHFFGGDDHDRPDGDHCSAFVSLLMTNSGWDPTYNHGGQISKGAGFVATQLDWLRKNWQPLGAGSSLKASQLQPGDVGIAMTGSLTHVWVYVGEIPGFGGTWAEASAPYGDSPGFAPQARKDSGVLYANNPGTTYFRRKAAPTNGPWVSPISQRATITSPYGWRMNPVHGRRLFHYGVDVSIPTGTPLRAACAGTVASHDNYPAWGGYVLAIKCGSWYVRYAHLSKFIAPPGQVVKPGDVIALSGGAPGAVGAGGSTGPHLHFQIQAQPGESQAALNTTVDPVPFMKAHGAPL